ncbi:acyl carrier protein [Streptosporangium sp. NPDC000239]|uniref:Acyl carrier protein n=1 Tax=Streptosporangium jomthongense TaxID=1193683 RepID=A0ABV8F939_9ACTN
MTELNVPAGLAPAQRAQIKSLICEILEIDPDGVTETSLFSEDHGADSLRAIEILAALERTLKVSIDQEELVRMTNLEGVYTVVTEASAR